MPDLAEMLGTRESEAYVAARSGDYHLLLGAGASFGAKNPRGQELPMAAALIDRLRRQYPDALIEDGNTLHRAYQRAVTEAGADSVWRFLKTTFGRADHQPWFTHLAGLPWKQIWTLNIDDTFERAFHKSKRNRVSTLRSIDWTDPFLSTDDIQIVHLHGSILANDPTPLVFSFTEYVTLAERRPVWDQVLKGQVPSSPFIIIGAKCLDDPDIEATLLTTEPRHSAPSIIVDPTITPGQRRELEERGYLVFRATAEDFINQWTQFTNFNEAGLDELYKTTAISLPQFSELRLEDVAEPPGNHDFIGGSEPLWSDATNNSIARFDWIRQEINAAERWILDRNRAPSAHIVFADRLSGLSSGLYQVAYAARLLGATVLSFNRAARFERKRLVDFCVNRGPVVIICDTAHEFAIYFNDLLQEVSGREDCSILVIFAERKSRELQVDNHFNLPVDRRRTNIITRRRNKNDARAIEHLLNTRGRLGKLEQRERADRVAYFQNRDIFSAMAEVEQGRGFHKRLVRELRALHREWHRDLLMVLALASEGGHQVGLQEAAFAMKVNVTVLLNDIANDANLNALVEVSGDLIFARQRTSSLDDLFKRDELEDRLAALAEAVKSLSGLATSNSLKERNRPASLVGGLMQARLLRWVFPGTNIGRFYEKLLPSFGDWNARFWEQRAINAKLDGDWGPAESWASRAVTIKDDPYTRTTLGTILINKATIAVDNADSGWIELYRRGQRELDEALKQDLGNRVASVSFLENSLNLMRRILKSETFAASGDLLAAIRADWTSSYAAIQLFGAPDDSARRRASELVREYELLFPSDVSPRDGDSRLNENLPPTVRPAPRPYQRPGNRSNRRRSGGTRANGFG